MQTQIANQRGKPLVELGHHQRVVTLDMKEQEQRVFRDIVAIAGLDAIDAIDFAAAAIEEAEYSVLQAVASRMEADELGSAT